MTFNNWYKTAMLVLLVTMVLLICVLIGVRPAGGDYSVEAVTASDGVVHWHLLDRNTGALYRASSGRWHRIVMPVAGSRVVERLGRAPQYPTKTAAISWPWEGRLNRDGHYSSRP